MSKFVFVDAPPKIKAPGRKRMYTEVYEACKQNPGKWTIWKENTTPTGNTANLQTVYPGTRFSRRKNAKGTVDLWGSYVES